MGSLHLAAIADLLGARYNGAATVPAGAAVDSRRVQPGDLFVATRGERVDGHDYVEAAAARGAVAAVTERPVAASIPCLPVRDPLLALSELGRANRAAFPGVVLSITGSCGKTSVKNMCRSIFELAGRTVATAGNYNNEIGVPLTLTRLSDATQFAIVEMGATGRGHVAHLCELARPQISTVLNAMEAHLLGFGSVEDVADIKAEIYDGLTPGDVAVLNLDSPYAPLWQERIAAAGSRLVTYSRDRAADVRGEDACADGLAGTRFTLRIGERADSLFLPLPGLHHVSNALAAAALATAAGIAPETIVAGLERAQPAAGRLQHETLADGTELIDDSYNANPGSVRAAIDLLAGAPAPRTLVLGEMLELGDASEAMHAEMGERARARGIERLVGVGAALAPTVTAFGTGAELLEDRAAVAAAARRLLAASATILVKGSRGAAMETVIADLRDAAAGQAATGEGAAC